MFSDLHPLPHADEKMCKTSIYVLTVGIQCWRVGSALNQHMYTASKERVYWLAT
jgi:hypothetical protein